MQNTAEINLPNRDIRISAQGIQTAVQSASATSAFADTIAQRYTNALPLLQRMAMVLRSQAGVTLAPAYHNTHLQWMPHLKLTVLTNNIVAPEQGQAPTRSNSTNASRSWQSFPQTAQTPSPIQTQILTKIQRQTEIIATENLTHQLITRRQRIESINSPGKVSRSSSIVNSPPVPRVVRRTPDIENYVDVTSNPIKRSPTSTTNWEPKSSFSRAIPKAPEVNINQITDQVVHAIDRRLMAYRERMGRM